MPVHIATIENQIVRNLGFGRLVASERHDRVNRFHAGGGGELYPDEAVVMRSRLGADSRPAVRTHDLRHRACETWSHAHSRRRQLVGRGPRSNNNPPGPGFLWEAEIARVDCARLQCDDVAWV